MPGHYDSVRPKDAPPKKAKKVKKQKKRLPQPIRGVLNFVNEEKAAAQEDYATIRKLKKNPRY